MSGKDPLGFVLPYVPIMIVRLATGANAFLVSYLSPGGNIAVGYVLAAYTLVEALSSTIAGQLADRIGRRVTLILGYSWLTVLMLALYLSIRSMASVMLVAALNGLMGFGAALVLVSSLTMVTDLTERGHRGLGMGAFDMVNILGYAAGYLVGSALYQAMAGSSAMLAQVIMLIALYPIFLRYIMETRPVSKGVVYINPLRGLPREALATMPLWLAITITLGSAIYAGRVLGKVEGVAPIRVGALVLGAVMAIGLGSVMFGHLSDRIGRFRTMAIGIVGVTVGLVVLAVTLLTGVNPILAVAAASPFIFMASAIVPSILSLVGDTSLVSMRGSSMGLYGLMLGLGMGIGNIMGGYVYVHMGLGGIALALLVVFAIALAAYLVLKHTG